MCIINLLPSKKLNRILINSNYFFSDSCFTLGVFLPSKSIQHIISIKKKYALIIVYYKANETHFHLIDSMNQLTHHSIFLALDRFEAFMKTI